MNERLSVHIVLDRKCRLRVQENRLNKCLFSLNRSMSKNNFNVISSVEDHSSMASRLDCE